MQPQRSDPASIQANESTAGQPPQVRSRARSAPGPRAVRDALVLPVRARQLHRALFVGATLRVEVPSPPDPLTLVLVADDTGDRQRRRKTWDQNLARHALPEAAQVKLDVSCRDELRAWLGGRPPREAGVGGGV